MNRLNRLNRLNENAKAFSFLRTLKRELVPKLIDYALKRMVRKLCLRWNKLLEKPVKSY
jgi:hypothetical protein